MFKFPDNRLLVHVDFEFVNPSGFILKGISDDAAQKHLLLSGCPRFVRGTCVGRMPEAYQRGSNSVTAPPACMCNSTRSLWHLSGTPQR
jgi:hypothetical protein